jgi:hypothetical protein
MSELTANRRRLFALDADLRAEADKMLAESGLGKIFQEAGYVPVGSYAMGTMTWRDLDFEFYTDTPDWEKHWEFGLKLNKHPWLWSFDCLNAWRDPRFIKDAGYYWGLAATRPGAKEYWKLDLWTASREDFARGAPQRPLWESRLNDDTRYHILEIKEAVCTLPEYRKSLLSVHIYEAVLEHGIHGVDAFRDWWRNTKANPAPLK